MIVPISLKGAVDHSTLVEWVWSYFSDAPKNGASSSSGGGGQPPSLMSKLTGPVQLSSKQRSTMHSRYIVATSTQLHQSHTHYHSCACDVCSFISALSSCVERAAATPVFQVSGSVSCHSVCSE